MGTCSRPPSPSPGWYDGTAPNWGVASPRPLCYNRPADKTVGRPLILIGRTVDPVTWSLLLKCAATMGVAMTPVLELRGAIPFGLAMGMAPWLVFLVSVVGNLIPVPAIILCVRTVFRALYRHPWWQAKLDAFIRRAHLKGRMVRKYRVPDLILLVAIPLPGTGAWTGALVATLFNIRMRVALPSILLGIVIAGGITTAVSCGVISLAF